MSGYPNLLTPPSSSEDSPQSVYLATSPNSTTFEPENYEFPTIHPSVILENPSQINLQQSASLHFVEQPTDRFRFRYKSEMAGTHGSLTGINSDKSRKPTYPTVEVRNWVGKVIVRCSIYQSNAKGRNFLPHAHRLIMKKGRDELDDPHDMVIGPEDGYRAVFQGMGIIHTAKKNIVAELLRKKTQLQKEHIALTENRIRELTTKEQIEIKGLAESESKSINLNIVCLRFDAFTESNGILYPICNPIYSHGINNLKSALTGDLKIVRLDHVVSPAKGNKEIFILVERVTKKNIKIRFYELDDNDTVVWEDWGKFNDLDVHHQYAIVFKTPKYRDENITSPVNVFIELIRPSDGARSESREFKYIPNKNILKPGQKRARYDYETSSSYSISNVGSGDLPLPINNLQIDQNMGSPLSNFSGVLSDELKNAMNNINSEEFQKMFSEYGQEYISICDSHLPCDTLAMDNLARSKLSSNTVSNRTTDSSRKLIDSHTSPVKIEVSQEDKEMYLDVTENLRRFIRTTHTAEKAKSTLRHYFGKDDTTNALHVSIMQRDIDATLLLLKIIVYYRQFDLLEKYNNDKQTALHLAVLCHNEQMVNSLLLCKAKISALDANLNTPLHLAALINGSVYMFEMLLRTRECEKMEDFINLENDEGNTALELVIQSNYHNMTKNLTLVKLLCSKGADVNKCHPKNGFVPLRFAIETKCTEIVKYLLSLNHIIPGIRDFQNVSPLSAAFIKEMPEELTEVVKSYMSSRDIRLDIKEEPDDDSEEEMDQDEPVEVKSEIPNFSLEELEKMYSDVHCLTPQCLDEVASILDKSENWKCLAELLEIEHLVSSGIIHSDISMSKAVLVYSIETSHDSIWMIRNFLDNLSEFKAVEVIDKMVLEMKNK
nr:relish-2 protein [Altica viridicyanea]